MSVEGMIVLFIILFLFLCGSYYRKLSEKGSHEIILDLGSEQNLDSLYIHLGHILDRIMAVSYYDEAKERWIPLQKEVELEANYN